jgi:hypothetical protein
MFKKAIFLIYFENSTFSCIKWPENVHVTLRIPTGFCWFSTGFEFK